MNETAYTALADHYDRLSTHDTVRWADFIRRRLAERGVQPGSRLLDVACGTGALTLALYRSGFSVQGSDLSADMLKVAARRAMLGNAGIAFTCADMRDFSCHSPYSAVLANCDAVNYLHTPEDANAFFACANRALKPGGVLMFDISTEKKLQDMDEETYSEEWEDGLYIWNNSFQKQKKLLKMELSFFIRQENGLYKREKETHFQKAWDVEELKELLVQNQFSPRLYDDLKDRGPTEESLRIHFVAVKN